MSNVKGFKTGKTRFRLLRARVHRQKVKVLLNFFRKL